MATRIRVGARFQTVFEANTKKDSAFRFRATHIGDTRSAKAVLCDDDRITAGQACEVRVVRVSKPKSKDKGAIEVEWLGPVSFALDENVYVPEMLRLKLQALLETGRNILLDGPQGSGKTTLAREVARALNFAYVYVNCAPIFESTDFLATLQLRATDGGGVETAWVESDIARAFADARATPDQTFLVFLDEFNRCRDMARNGVMPALDSTRRMYNPVTGRVEPIPDNVLWIAAINNGAQFTGTSTVDPAQLDRFAPLKIDYLPVEEEARILAGRYPDVPPKTIRRVVRIADAVRRDEELTLDLSMRATDEVVALLAHPNFAQYDGDPLPALLQDSFCGRVQGTWNDPGSDAGMMWDVVSKAL